MKSLAFAAILVSVCSAAACSSSDTDGTGGSGGTGSTSSTTTTTTTTTTSSTTVTTTTATTTSGGPTDCSQEPDTDTCVDCCGNENQAGIIALNDIFVTYCACAAGSTCDTACNSDDPTTDVCGDDGTINQDAIQANQACIPCLQGVTNMDACIMPVVQDCQADADCLALLQCQQDCP